MQPGAPKLPAFRIITPPSSKTLSEAKGYVIADYQDHLEQVWIDELKEMFPIKVNKKTLNSITK